MAEVHDRILQIVIAALETGANAGSLAITAVNYARDRGLLDDDNTFSVPFSGGGATTLAAISSDSGGGPEVTLGTAIGPPTHIRIVGILTSA